MNEGDDGGAERSWPGDLANAISGSADVPCNTHIYFDTIDGNLNMTVCNRSNDVWWGAHGANAVHFSFLLEYVASMTGLPMGVYRQFSNNYHVYTNIVAEESLMPLAREIEASDKYACITPPFRKPLEIPLRQTPLIDPALWGTCSLEPLADIQSWLSDPSLTSSNVPFLSAVARPMWYAWAKYKEKDYHEAVNIAESIRSDDWKIACVDWLRRRQVRAGVNSQRFTEVVDTNGTAQTEDTTDGNA